MEELPIDSDQNPNSPPPAKEKSPQEIYQQFKTFARDFFTKHPPKNKAEQRGGRAFRNYKQELEQSELEILNLAGSIDPKAFLELFIADPPEILIDQSTDPEKIDLKPVKPIFTIIPPTPEERKLASATIENPELITQDQSLNNDFSLAMQNFQAFLRSPTLNDGFGVNEEQHRTLRRPYRSALYLLANLIEELSGQKSQPSFLKSLTEFYAQNRLAKRQNLITVGVDLLRKLTDLPNRERIIWLEPLIQIIAKYDELNPKSQEKTQTLITTESFEGLQKSLESIQAEDPQRKILEDILKRNKPQKENQRQYTTTEKLPVYSQIASDILRLFSSSQPEN